MDRAFIGTTVKLEIKPDPNKFVSLDDSEFEVNIWAAPTNKDTSEKPDSNIVHKMKSDCIKAGTNTYVIEVPTETIGRGFIICRVCINVPDIECASGYRREVLQILPDIQVV